MDEEQPQYTINACNAPIVTTTGCNRLYGHAGPCRHIPRFPDDKQLTPAEILYAHTKKRLMDEFGIELTEEWEQRVLSGEHDVPFRRPVSIEWTPV